MRPYLRIPYCLFLAVSLYQICPGTVALGQEAAPAIGRVELNGKRLVVTGFRFDAGAVIEINGREVATRAAFDTPTERLIAKKGGKRIAIDASSFITVRNSDNQRSRPYFVFRTEDFIAAEVIALATQQANVNFHAASLSLKADDYFAVDLAGISNITLTHTEDPNMVLDLLTQPPFDNNSRFLYRVRRSGSALLNFTQVFDEPGGDVPPFVLFITIDVE